MSSFDLRPHFRLDNKIIYRMTYLWLQLSHEFHVEDVLDRLSHGGHQVHLVVAVLRDVELTGVPTYIDK